MPTVVILCWLNPTGIFFRGRLCFIDNSIEAVAQRFDTKKKNEISRHFVLSFSFLNFIVIFIRSKNRPWSVVDIFTRPKDSSIFRRFIVLRDRILCVRTVYLLFLSNWALRDGNCCFPFALRCGAVKMYRFYRTTTGRDGEIERESVQITIIIKQDVFIPDFFFFPPHLPGIIERKQPLSIHFTVGNDTRKIIIIF